MTVSGMALEVFEGEAVANSNNAPSAPTAPTLSTVASGSQALRVERVKITHLNFYGESAPSTEVFIQVPANYVVVVNRQYPVKDTGPYPGKPTTWNVYATSGASGTETLQNTVPITTGIYTWQEPATGFIAGSALPTAVAPNPAFISNTSTLPITNAAPPTGNITVAQSPAGTSNTNTGRTTEATASYMAALLNILNVGTTPPPTGNLRY